MKAYWKFGIAVFVLVFVAAGGMAFSSVPEKRALAQEAAVPEPGAAPGMRMDADAGEAAVPQAQADTPTPTPYPSVSAGKPIVLVDYTSYTAWLAVGAKDKYLMLEVLNVKKDKAGQITSSTVGSQYVYDLLELTKSAQQKGIQVDLSFLKGTSEQYIRVYGDSNPSNATDVQIHAQPKKPGIKYAGGAFTEKIDKKDTVLNAAQLDKYEYRTLYGSKWSSLKNYNGTTSAIAGTTLLIRERATALAPAGVEVKLKIPAAAKAPKVTIDYVKGIINIPKGVQFKVFALGKEGNWVTLDAAAKLTPVELLDKFIPYTMGPLTNEEKTAALEKNGFSIIARTAAVQKDGVVTKAASQPVFVDIPATTKVTKVENQEKIVGSVATVYLTYQNVDKGIGLTAVGGNFDYSVDGGKNWKIVKPDAKSPTVVTLKADAAGLLIRESGAKEIKAKDGTITPARLPSSNSISVAWLPPLAIDVAGQGVGVDGAQVTAGSNVEWTLGISQGKTQITDATVTHTTTLPPASTLTVTGGKITFVAPAYNESGTNTYVIKITAQKTKYTTAVRELSITVTKE